MKKRSAFLCCFIMASLVMPLNIVAESQSTYPAKTTGKANYGGKKFYINPGHGGHDSDDRPTAMPCGVEMFYESDGNLDRAFHLKDFLVENNANVKMSRTQNTSSDDLGLSTIASYANSYGGYFISLHSNGANASANYIVSFYRSTSAAPNTEKVSGSKAMATAVSNWQDAVTLSDQTYATPRAYADYSFYGYNLGVLRTNNCVGYLVESWFHDYRPEALRMKSSVYNKFLAWQIARAAMQSPGATGSLDAVVMGDIRDLSKSCGYTNYTTRNRDKYKAVEGATVKLLNSQGVEIQSMSTDQCENGFYAFFVKDTGKYTIEVSKGGYRTNTKTITISALSTQQMCNFDMEEGEDRGIKVNPTTVDFGKVALGASSSIDVVVTGSSLTEVISVVSDNPSFKISTATLSATGGSFNVTFVSETAGSYTGTITLTSGTETKTIIASAEAYNPPLELLEVWNFSETSGVNKDWTENKAVLRNMCYGDGKLFVVKPSENSEILIVDARSGEKIGTVNTEGVSGGVFSIMDVQYVDGKLLGTNLATDASLKVYVWNNGVDKAPSVLLNTSDKNGFARIGDTFSVKGSLQNGTLCYAAGSTSEQNKIVMYRITNGEANTKPETVNITADGTADGGIKLGVSPRVVPDIKTDKYWVMGQNYYPSLVSSEGLLESTVSQEALNNVVYGNAFTTFTFKGSNYAFATTYLPASESLVGKNMTGGRVVLLDGTNGWASAENIGEYPSNGLGTTPSTNFSSNVVVNVVDNECVEMWVLVNMQGIAYYRYESSANAENYPDIAPEGVSLNDEYKFTTDFESEQIPELVGKTIRRAIMRDGLFYVLALDGNNNPYIYVLDPDAKQVKSTLSTNGVVMASAGGGTGVSGYTNSLQLPMSDIAFTADGYLLACNYTINQDAGVSNVVDKGYFRVYKWDRDLDTGIPFGEPIELVKTANNGFWNYAKVGYSFAVSGNLKNCDILTGAVTTGSSAQIRFVKIKFSSNSGKLSYEVNDARLGTSPFTGEKYQLNVSPVNNTYYVIDGITTSLVPTEFAVFADKNSSTGYSFEVKNTMSADVTPALNYFKYSGTAVMVTPKVDGSGVVVGVSLANVSSSFITPTPIATGIKLASVYAGNYSMVGVTVKENYMYMYLLTDDKISKLVCKLYSTGDETLPTDGKTYDWVGGYSCENLWVMQNSEDVTYPFITSNSRSACVYDGIVYIAHSVGGYVETCTADIYKYDAETGKYLGVMKVTTDGTTELQGYYVANQIGVDNYGNLWIAEFRSSFYGGVVVRVINKETGEVEHTTGYIGATGVSGWGNIYTMDLVGDVTLKNDGCVIMVAAHAGSNNLRIARLEASKNGTFKGGWDDETEPYTKTITTVSPGTATAWGNYPQLRISHDSQNSASVFYVDGANTYPAVYDNTGTMLWSYSPNTIEARGISEFVMNGETFIAYTNVTDGSSVEVCRLNGDYSIAETMWELSDLGDYTSYACCLSKDDTSTPDTVYLLNYVPNKGLAMYKIYYNYDEVVGVDNITESETVESVEYYNLQGVRVVNPRNGIFIKKQGNKTQKIIL